VSTAAVVVITIPDPDSVRRIVEHSKILAPATPILARARYHTRRWELELAGASVVVDEEHHVGLRLAAELRKQIRHEA
jgi:voltage-gated potassium channel Kch